eukprot:6224450-Karenia_brevis.AAC.1
MIGELGKLVTLNVRSNPGEHERQQALSGAASTVVWWQTYKLFGTMKVPHRFLASSYPYSRQRHTSIVWGMMTCVTCACAQKISTDCGLLPTCKDF